MKRDGPAGREIVADSMEDILGRLAKGSRAKGSRIGMTYWRRWGMGEGAWGAWES